MHDSKLHDDAYWWNIQFPTAPVRPQRRWPGLGYSFTKYGPKNPTKEPDKSELDTTVASGYAVRRPADEKEPAKKASEVGYAHTWEDANSKPAAGLW